MPEHVYYAQNVQLMCNRTPKLITGLLHVPKLLQGMLSGEAVPHRQAGLAGRFNYG